MSIESIREKFQQCGRLDQLEIQELLDLYDKLYTITKECVIVDSVSFNLLAELAKETYNKLKDVEPDTKESKVIKQLMDCVFDKVLVAQKKLKEVEKEVEKNDD